MRGYDIEETKTMYQIILHEMLVKKFLDSAKLMLITRLLVYMV